MKTETDNKRLEDETKKLLKSFFAARNKWDKKWSKFFDKFQGDYAAEQRHDAEAATELREIFRKYCKSDTEVDEGISYADPPTYDEHEFLSVAFPTKKKVTVVVKTGEFGTDSEIELENATEGLRIVRRRSKSLSGRMAKDYL